MHMKQPGEWATQLSKPASSTMSITGASSTSTAEEPKSSSTAETNQFSTLEDKDPAPSNDSLATSGTSSHSLESGKTPSLSNLGDPIRAYPCHPTEAAFIDWKEIF